MLPTSSSFPSPSFIYLTSPLLFCHVLCYFFFNLFSFFPWLLATPLSSFYHLFFLQYSSNPPSLPPSLPFFPPFPSTHQSLALASLLRTYGMMDRRASGTSKAKGHLPGALRCRGALGPAMQPRPHTSVSRHSHSHKHTHTHTPCIQQHLL